MTLTGGAEKVGAFVTGYVKAGPGAVAETMQKQSRAWVPHLGQAPEGSIGGESKLSKARISIFSEIVFCECAPRRSKFSGELSSLS